VVGQLDGLVRAPEEQRHAGERLVAIGRLAQQVADRRVAVVHQQVVDRRRIGDVERHAPDRGRGFAASGLEARDQRMRPLGVAVARDIEERRQQRRANHRQALARDQLARDHGHVGVEGVEQRAVRVQVLPHDGVEARVEFPRGHHDREVVHVVVRAGDDAHRGVDASGRERFGLGAESAHARHGGIVGRVGVDDRHLEALGVERPHDLAAETTVAAHHPCATRGRILGIEPGAGQPGEPRDQPVGGRGRDRERELLAEAGERIDDVVGTERGHVDRSLPAHRPRQHGKVRLEQAHGHRHGEIGLVVVGERQHAAALVPAQPGRGEVVRQPCVRGERERRLAEVHQVQLLGARLVDLHDDEAPVAQVERTGDQLAGLAEAADQVERLDQRVHAAAESPLDERLAHGLVAPERQQVGEQVGPADHRRVDD